MAEDTRIQADIKDADGNVLVTAFSTDGQPKTKAQFQAVTDAYNSGAKIPAGFTVLQPGVTNKLRSAFEAVNQPLQRGAQAVGALPNIPQVEPQSPMDANWSSSSTPNGIIQLLNMAKGAVPAIASTVNTPEKAGTALGTAAGAVATGGMSLGPQMAGMGIGAGLGHLLGAVGTGSPDTAGTIAVQSAIAGISAAASQGIIGGVKAAMGISMSQQAQKVVEDGLGKMMKDNYSHIIQNPEALNAVLSTPNGLAKAVQAYSDGLKYDVDEFSKAIIPEIQAILPKRLLVGTQNTLRANIRNFVNASNDAISAVDDPKALALAQQAIAKARADIGNTIVADLAARKTPSELTPAAMAQLKSVMDAGSTRIDTLSNGIKVLSTIKQAGGDTGLDIPKFQEAMKGIYMQRPAGGSMQQAGQIAGRGADILSSSDTSQRLNLTLGAIPGVKNIPMLGNILKYIGINMPAGVKYTGNVPYQSIPMNAAANLAGQDAINSFFNRK